MKTGETAKHHQIFDGYKKGWFGGIGSGWRNNRRYVGEWVCSNSINYFWRSETTYYPVGSGAVWGKSGV